MLNGITLIALVVTIVILIILATVSIGAIFGENGLIKQSEQAKFEAEKADAREQIELVLADAFVEKKVNPGYDENGFLDKFIKDRLPNVGIDTDEIELNGFVFELDRSVPRIGKYKGQSTGPRIEEIKVNDKTTSSISVEVIAKNAEGATYTYSYKKDTEGEEAWKEAGEESTNTFTFSGLEANVTYNIKVKVENKEGKVEEIVNVLTGELPTGEITITDPVWAGDGTASVTINTEETSLTLQYQIDGIAEGSWTNTTSGSTISGLRLGQTLYARLFDGTNGTEPASVSVTDTVAPVVTVTPGGTTTNSVTVSVVAVDNESGMAGSLTYTYYIKQTSEPDTSYVAKATDVPDASYTLTGLTQETSYDVKVEVKADNAGNAGSGVLTGQVTTKVPGGGVEEGAITFGTPIWSSGTASVTVSTNTGMQIEYQVGGITEGSWTNISNGGTIPNLQHGQTVYARLTDGTNHGDYASVSVTDTVAPIVSAITPGTITENSIEVTISASDNESGIAFLTIELKNVTDDEDGTEIQLEANQLGEYEVILSNDFNIDIKPGKEYEINVIAFDMADNTSNKVSVTVDTPGNFITVEEVLKEGDYVNYVDGIGQTKKCAVLYGPENAKYSRYGIQIITMESVGSVMLGYGDPTVSGSDDSTKAMNSYNNAINTLNSEAMKYNNSTYSIDARCVGSVPDDKNYDGEGMYINNDSWFSEYNGLLKKRDENYWTDIKQINALNIGSTDGVEYWIASRETNELYDSVDPNHHQCKFNVRSSLIYIADTELWSVDSYSGVSSFSATNGLRPVFTLKPGIKVTGGDGTGASPYELDV